MEGKASTEGPVEVRGPPGVQRPFWIGLLLVVLTLGIYHFYWHYVTHKEVSGYLRQRNLLVYVWLLYLLGGVVGLVFLTAFPQTMDPGRSFSEFGSLLGYPELGVKNVLIVGLTELCFIVYVAGQFRLLYRARGGGSWRASATWFIVACYIGWAGAALTASVSLFLPLVFIALIAIVYYSLQADYNDLWQEVEHSRGASMEIDPAHLARATGACRECGGSVAGEGTAGAELTVPCPVCGTRSTLRLPLGQGPLGD